MWWVIVEIFWLVLVGGEYILAGGGCWWVVVDIFWMLVDGGYILASSGWWHGLV